jgi:hypothetical protein
MSSWLAAGVSMAFEVAKDSSSESLGGSGAGLFAFGAVAFAAIVVLVVASGAALSRCESTLDEIGRELDREEAL